MCVVLSTCEIINLTLCSFFYIFTRLSGFSSTATNQHQHSTQTQFKGLEVQGYTTCQEEAEAKGKEKTTSSSCFPTYFSRLGDLAKPSLQDGDGVPLTRQVVYNSS